MVNPASSIIKHSTITELVATFDDHISFSACNEGCVDLNSAAIAINMMIPTLVPPNCVAA